MELNEQEQLLKELENAIDRLSALYNQYFMGIEKIEPLIPKKDVERRFNVLRKEKFQNTAQRFRFQMQVQKYTTQSAHWKRICRQIEEGTYERDLRRAHERLQKVDETALAQKALSSLGDEDSSTGASVDAGALIDGIDDPFDEKVSLADQLGQLAALAAASVEKKAERRSTSLDSVHPASPDAAVAAVKPTAVPIPVSSLKVSARMPVTSAAPPAVAKESDGEALSAFFRRPSIAPPPAPRAGATPPKAPPPPPRSLSAPPQKPAPPSPKPAPPKTATPATGASLSEDRIRSVYRAYVTARKQTGEATDNITLDRVAAILKKTSDAKGGVSDFKVVIRDGKAVIKTVK